MIGSVTTSRDIPAGAVIYYDSDKNALVVFDSSTKRVHVMVIPFVLEGVEPDPRFKVFGL